MSEADSITPLAAAGDERVQRRLGGGGAGVGPLGRLAARVAQPVVQRAGRPAARAARSWRPWLSRALTSDSACSTSWPAADRSISAATLTSSRKRATAPVHVGGGVQAHLAELTAHLRNGVQQLVAHDPERGVQALGRAEQLLLHAPPRRPTARRARPRAAPRAGGPRPASGRDSTRLSRAREAASGHQARPRAPRGRPAVRARFLTSAAGTASVAGRRARLGSADAVSPATNTWSNSRPRAACDVQHLHRAARARAPAPPPSPAPESATARR